MAAVAAAPPPLDPVHFEIGKRLQYWVPSRKRVDKQGSWWGVQVMNRRKYRGKQQALLYFLQGKEPSSDKKRECAYVPPAHSFMCLCASRSLIFSLVCACVCAYVCAYACSYTYTYAGTCTGTYYYLYVCTLTHAYTCM